MWAVRALLVVLALAVGCACESPEEKHKEEAYAKEITEILIDLQSSYASTSARCEGGPIECAVAAQDGSEATRLAKSRVVGLTPPRKLEAANRKLVECLEHLAQAYDEIADTYWDRSGMYEAYMRSVALVRKSMEDAMSAALLIGFKGDGDAWRAR